ncbi:tRNA synthetases class I, catalytic domain-containing protein [Aspergillus coremiiformis]|uniref:glutamine--tRNA ligase n=1 Tax=Aspergillus coremiiformis TaxID=138285 RepID=A0A5N6ZII2_9EURO|nr:tRNA synthetases class I, catalytic domain-containing protein [Aspergillus coremiiformis]
MAETVTDGLAKLQLDPETGEMVSKSELKKRMQKRAKKASKAAAKTNPSNNSENKSENKPPRPAEPTLDPDAMFKQGFLADVYNLRPSPQVRTRFPPEPNGYLHLGHAKAIAINFGFARYYGGETILRFDDTNPDAEEEKYFHAIEEIVRWLGFTPHQVTYSSDNFQKLYDLAEKLIQLEKAYVCHCNEADLKMQRGGEDGKTPRFYCAHAAQDVDTNLAKFRDMAQGKYEPQAAFLRMRQELLSNGNPQMWDIVAYRIPKNRTPHIRTGTKWHIYPSYDFAHCLCDSFENITHSLCTTEFVTARESYEWLNKTLGVYEPMQREYGRLNITGTVMSKRALKELVEKKHVRDWDDPRLYTLIAIRRRGVPPGAILSFINELGVTTSQAIIQIARFEQSVRRYLETTVPRLMLVLDPIRVVIQDIGSLEGQELELPFSPKNPEFGTYKLQMTRTVYIDRSDFREVSSKEFFRLSPGQTVGLLQVPHPIKAVSFSKDPSTGQVTEIQAVLVPDAPKPKAYIHWVPEGSRKVTVRIHNALFKSDNPAAAEGGFLADLNPDSETIYSEALINSGFDEVRRRAPWPQAKGEQTQAGPESVRFQAMRVAYFAMDSDSTEDSVVLNRIVALKEDAKKDAES